MYQHSHIRANKKPRPVSNLSRGGDGQGAGMWQFHMKCPHCGTKMILGYLGVPEKRVNVHSEQSLKSSPLQAVICPDCGHVELQAISPEDLARHDYPDEEVDDEFSEEES